jgi:hypothetical protein
VNTPALEDVPETPQAESENMDESGNDNVEAPVTPQNKVSEQQDMELDDVRTKRERIDDAMTPPTGKKQREEPEISDEEFNHVEAAFFSTPDHAYSQMFQ